MMAESNGASLCVLRVGKSVASTMGFTGVDGLPMGTRCGNLDPGVILYLLDELGMDARAIEKLIYTQSGLLGVSGISSNMRTLEVSQDPRARFAFSGFPADTDNRTVAVSGISCSLQVMTCAQS